MELKLCVWPGNDRLASLDAECLAAVQLLRHLLIPAHLKNLEVTWIYDSSELPSNTLPALLIDGEYISGYHHIVKGLQSLGYDIDHDLSPELAAKQIALRHHLHSSAQPLLDYHLQVNDSNYTAVTHASYTATLPFPFGWLLPSHRYAKAERRAASIGLNAYSANANLRSNDADKETDPTAGGHLEASASPSLIFARARASKKSIKEQVNTARFKLETAVDSMTEPLSNALRINSKQTQSRNCLLDTEIRSIDILAWAYLHLLTHRAGPDITVRDILSERWPSVMQYMEALDTSLDERSEYSVQHISQASPSPWRRTSAFLTSIAHLILPQRSQEHVHYVLRSLPCTSSLLIISILAASTGIATLSYTVHTLLAPKRPRSLANQNRYTFFRTGARAGPRLGQMGESGATLAALFGPTSPREVSGIARHKEENIGQGVVVREEASRTGPGGVEVAEVDVEIERA